jgi:hypothetical protein
MTIPNDAISYLLSEDQNPEHTQRVYALVQPLLMKDERIEYIGIEDRVLSLDIRPESVVLTNRRFLLYSPKLLGGATFQDHIWRDLGDCKLTENMLRATLTFRTSAGKLIKIQNIPKKQARRIYAFAQQRELEALEERRARELEEKRAAAGGLYLGSPTPASSGFAASGSAAAPAQDPMAALGRLKELLQAGLITQEDFDKKKAEILSRL